MNPVVVACDLDRTLIYSRAAWGVPAEQAPPVLCVEEYQDAPLSYVTCRAAELLVELSAAAVVVPTTTRTRAQLARVTLPGTTPRYAIAANGGVLLVDGEPDAGWGAQVTRALAASSAPLAEVWAHVEAVFDAAWTSSRRVAEDLFCYAVVDRAAMPAGFVEELSAWAVERGWVTSLQGRKVYVVPSALTKGSAVREVAGRVGAGRVLAAGDSLLDAEMLAGADAAVRPPHGELADSGWLVPGLAVARRSGILGGEDVVAWLLAEVRRAEASVGVPGA